MLIDANWSSLIPGQLSSGCDFEWVRRQDALDADAASERAIPLSDIWHGLTLGKTKVLDHFMTDDRCFVIAASARFFVNPERPCPRKLDILESIFLDGNPKGVAFDFGLAVSSVATLTKQSLNSMGIRCTLRRVPPQFVMASFAAKDVVLGSQARLSQLDLLGSVVSVISVPRPDTGLSPLLSPAECIVTRLFVEGKTHSEIATLRGSSTRTVANQLASVFQRLRVSGRLRLIRTLATRAALHSRSD